MGKYLDSSGLSHFMGLVKTAISNAVSAIHGIPSGGTSGQVLAKSSGTDYVVGWVTPSSGSGREVPQGGSNRDVLISNGSSLNTYEWKGLLHVLAWNAEDYGAVYMSDTDDSIHFGSLSIAFGGTNATTAAGARTNLDVPGLSATNVYLNTNQTIRLTGVKTTSATNNITANVNKYWCIKDANDNYTTWVGTEARTDGSVRTTLGVRNYGTGAQVDNALYLDIANDGTRSIGFGGGTATRTAWRSALGVHAYGSFTGLSSNTTLASSAAKLPLNTFSGVGCSASSNGIKVEEDGTYMVWGSAYLYNNFTANDIVHLRLYKNSTYLSLETIYRTPLATPYTMVYMGPFIVTLAANDVLYLYAYNQTGARGVVQNSASCGLTIRRIA